VQKLTGILAYIFDQVTDAPTGSFTQVNSSRYHSCAVSTTGAVACWGIADSTAQDHGQVTKAPSSSFTQVSVGVWHSCGILTTGELECWGVDDGTLFFDFLQVKGRLAGVFDQISAGNYHNCGLRDNGNVGCWGDDSQGQTESP
jgi:alpha-tubulin suppressor-like RCC1 family protein